MKEHKTGESRSVRINRSRGEHDRSVEKRPRVRESLEKVKSSFMQGTPLQSEEHLLPGWARQARRVSRA